MSSDSSVPAGTAWQKLYRFRVDPRPRAA